MQWQVSDTQANRKLNAKDVEGHPWLCCVTKSSSVVGKKEGKIASKIRQLKIWWLPSAEAVAGSSAKSPCTAEEQGHLWAESGVWPESQGQRFCQRGGEKSWIGATVRAPKCWGGQVLLFTWPGLCLWEHCDSEALLGSIVRQWHWAPKIGQTRELAGGKLACEFGHVATSACHDQPNS